jgi:6-phosphofructokinase 1
VGIVNLMGRHSGFVAAHATIAARGVDVCLVPEVQFALEGPTGLLRYVESRVAQQGHCVIVVAEGAGQELLESVGEMDLSGNKKLADIGPFIKEEIAAHMNSKGTPASLKYVDPTYMVRATPANAADNILCLQLAHDAVHAAFAGYTNFMSGQVNGKSVIIPLSEAVGRRSAINPRGNFWQQLVFATGQPNWGQ